MTEQAITSGVDGKSGIPLNSEAEAMVRYLGMAREILGGITTFDQMDEAAQKPVVDDTAEVIKGIESRVNGGRYNNTSPEVLWAYWSQAFSIKNAPYSAPGRFRLALGIQAKMVYMRAFRMLEAGVVTMEALAEVQKRRSPSLDPLQGLRGPRFHDGQAGNADDTVSPLITDLPGM